MITEIVESCSAARELQPEAPEPPRRLPPTLTFAELLAEAALPSVTVGGTTIVTSVTDAELLRELEDNLVARELARAEEAFKAGNRAALERAVELLNTHRRDHPWPSWVGDALVADFAQQRAGPLKRRGRHAREQTRTRDDIVDCIRATTMDCYALVELPVTWEEIRSFKLSKKNIKAAAKAASELIGGDAGGTNDVMEQAYERFHDRVRTNSARYYPMIEWRAWLLLNAARNAPPSKTDQNS